jgi:hypothetical protein
LNVSTLSFAGELSRHGFAPSRAVAGIVASLAGTILGYLVRLWGRWTAAHLNTTQHLPARPAEKESIIVANFESWLSKAGKVAVVAAKNVVANIRPAAEEAQKLEPVEDLVLGPYGSDFNLIVDSVVSVEQAYAILAPQGGAGTEKAAKVLQLVESVLLPKLVAAGMTSEEAEAYIQRYIDAAVFLLNGPTVASNSTAVAASTTATDAGSDTGSADESTTTVTTATTATASSTTASADTASDSSQTSTSTTDATATGTTTTATATDTTAVASTDTTAAAA